MNTEPLDQCLAAETRPGRTWADRAEEAMSTLERNGTPFTADDLRELIGPDHEPHHPNAVGALFNQHRRAGLIRQVGWHTSTATKRNGGSHRRWIGVQNSEDGQ
ncbi:hypothetical protein [Corynebacterium kalidii]